MTWRDELERLWNELVEVEGVLVLNPDNGTALQRRDVINQEIKKLVDDRSEQLVAF